MNFNLINASLSISLKSGEVYKQNLIFMPANEQIIPFFQKENLITGLP